MRVTIKSALQITAFALFAGFMLMPWRWWLESGVDLGNMLAPPSLQHPLGTDNLGRDLLVRLNQVFMDAVLPVWIVTLAATLLGFCGGGVVAVLRPSWRDISRSIVGLCVGVPLGLLVFYAAVADEVIVMRTLLIPLAFVMFLRGVYFVLNCYEQDRLLGFWEANRAIGNPEIYRVLHYGFKQAWSRGLIRTAAFHLKIAVICEVGLSYLGFGIQEPGASFGNILASHFDSYLNGHFSVLIVVTAAIWLSATVPDIFLAMLPTLRRRNQTSAYNPPSTCMTSPVI